jgi:long-chain acyl-CoA synthetase
MSKLLLNPSSLGAQDGTEDGSGTSPRRVRDGAGSERHGALVSELPLRHGVMEGGGSYNLHARVQAVGSGHALPFLEEAAQKASLDETARPIVIADYGSSEGKNSLTPLRVAIGALRTRVGPERPIQVAHIDQAANDFNTLFDVIHRDPVRYSSGDTNVFSSAVGRSFYEQVFPAGTVDLGWCSYAAMWLSRIPTYVSGHIRGDCGTPEEREAFARQGAGDWRTFLSARARELRPGGRLVVALAGRSDEGVHGLEDVMEFANAVLAGMVAKGTILAEEKARMVLGSYPRSRRELLAPFASGGQFEGLTVEHCEISRVEDPSWSGYLRDKDADALASLRAQMFRATYAPSLADGLLDQGEDNRRAFAGRLEEALRERIKDRLVPVNPFVQTLVLVKQGAPRMARARSEPGGATLGDLLHAQTLNKPDATALLCDGREMSYRDLDISTTGLAHWLIGQGLKPGDRVAIHWSNSIETVQLFFAAFKAGIIAVPINLRLKAPEVAWILQHSQAKICFSEPSLAPLAEQALSNGGSLWSIETALPRLVAAGRAALPGVHERQPAAILYTSGSTSRPKGTVHTHRSLLEGTRIMAEQVFEANETVLAMTQMMHISGLGCAVLPAIYSGMPVALLPVFEPAAALDAIERYRSSFTFCLPALWHMIAEEQERNPRDVRSLRTAIGGGDCLPLSLQQRFARLFGVQLLEGIGMTETYPYAFNPRDANRPGSLGVPPPGVEVRIVDATGREVADGETGEMVVRSPVNCSGYWNDPAATEALLRGGWLHTGDLGMRDPDGYLWFKGRKKEIIVRAGSNISPQEVEEVLFKHPAVFEAGAIGVPHPVYGEIVVAFVSLRGGRKPDEQELREFARRSLADYKVPERILFLDQLPKGTTGKVQRSDLKTQFQQLAR